MDIDLKKQVRVWWDGGEVIGIITNVEHYTLDDDIYYNWYEPYPMMLSKWNYFARFNVRSVNGSLVTIDTQTIKQFKIANI